MGDTRHSQGPAAKGPSAKNAVSGVAAAFTLQRLLLAAKAALAAGLAFP